jgi:hypothetical protein
MFDHATAAELTPRSIAILGADALLVALPSTPTQLANACFADGYDEVFPATWGDELIAAGCLEQLEGRTGPAIFCACPLVAEQLRGAAELRRFIVPFISPPVAVALYLRARNPGHVLRITYVGDCPGAYDDAIDVRLSPHELLSALSSHGILPAAQRPDLGDEVAHDRRRFYSLPGGAPAPQWLAAQWPKRALVDVHAGDALAGLAHHTLSRGNTLIDFAPHLGCACAGAVGGADAAHARKAVAALEPPRAQSEIVDGAVHVEVSLAPAGEHHDGDVAWGDFLAALPAALAMHPDNTSAPLARQSARRSPRRALQNKRALPRAYMAARAGARRERRAASPAASTPHPRREPALSDAPTAVSIPRSAANVSHREEISAARPNPWLARRASQEGMTGPRGASALRAGLATADRWLLAGLMLTSSLLGAVLTSALTVRGMQHSAAVSTPGIALHSQPPAPIAAAAESPSRDSVAIARAAHGDDSALVAVAAHSDGTRDREEAGGAVAPPPAATRLSPMPAQVVRVPKRVSAPVERRPVSLAERAHSAPASSVVSTSSIATPTNAAMPSAARTPATAAPSITLPANGASSAAPPAAAAPASAASPLANPAVLEELRAIHAEIDARKRHMDSLTSALDSLNRASKPD